MTGTFRSIEWFLWRSRSMNRHYSISCLHVSLAYIVLLHLSRDVNDTWRDGGLTFRKIRLQDWGSSTRTGSLWRSWDGMPVQTSCLHWRTSCWDYNYFSMHMQGKAMTTKLRNYVQILQDLPVTSAACQRGFSQMNRPHTAVRNRLAVRSTIPWMICW